MILDETKQGKEEILVVTVKDKHFQFSVSEIISLIENLEAQVMMTVTMHRDSVSTSAYLGKGKIDEVKKILAEFKIDTVVINDNISAAQKRVIENKLQKKVLDRTEIILAIFAQRASTKEAKIQVELAQLQYLFPRLTKMWGHLSRQQGGIGMRGVGEKQLEIDRRIVNTRISRLKGELEKVKQYRHLQRKKRIKSASPVVALVGYTNAGKSSLFNYFKGKDVFAKDQLFATLDTITKKIGFNQKAFYLVDTVGFITNLPHFLIESFKATLEEVLISDLLLHVIDCADPNYEKYIKAVNMILKELGMDEKPIIKVYNKIDLLPHLPFFDKKSISISVKTGENLDVLLEKIDKELKKIKKTTAFKQLHEVY